VDRAEYEWLAQPGAATVAAPVYGDAYTDSLMAGWDEIAPSITGDEFSDHGEVWSVDWSVTGVEAGRRHPARRGQGGRLRAGLNDAGARRRHSQTGLSRKRDGIRRRAVPVGRAPAVSRAGADHSDGSPVTGCGRQCRRA